MDYQQIPDIVIGRLPVLPASSAAHERRKAGWSDSSQELGERLGDLEVQIRKIYPNLVSSVKRQGTGYQIEFLVIT